MNPHPNVAFVHIKGLKGMKALQTACAHNSRADGTNLPHVNSHLSRENLDAFATDPVPDPIDRYFRRLQHHGCKVPGKKRIWADEMVFSTTRSVKDVESWFHRTVEFCLLRFGSTRIFAGWCHVDEQTFHCHILFVPFVEGELAPRGRPPKHSPRKEARPAVFVSHRQFFSGKKKGIEARRANATALSELQTDYARSVSEFGLIRGVAGTNVKQLPTGHVRRLSDDNKALAEKAIGAIRIAAAAVTPPEFSILDSKAARIGAFQRFADNLVVAIVEAATPELHALVVLANRGIQLPSTQQSLRNVAQDRERQKYENAKLQSEIQRLEADRKSLISACEDNDKRERCLKEEINLSRVDVPLRDIARIAGFAVGGPIPVTSLGRGVKVDFELNRFWDLAGNPRAKVGSSSSLALVQILVGATLEQAIGWVRNNFPGHETAAVANLAVHEGLLSRLPAVLPRFTIEQELALIISRLENKEPSFAAKSTNWLQLAPGDAKERWMLANVSVVGNESEFVVEAKDSKGATKAFWYYRKPGGTFLVRSRARSEAYFSTRDPVERPAIITTDVLRARALAHLYPSADIVLCPTAETPPRRHELFDTSVTEFRLDVGCHRSDELAVSIHDEIIAPSQNAKQPRVIRRSFDTTTAQLFEACRRAKPNAKKPETRDQNSRDIEL